MEPYDSNARESFGEPEFGSVAAKPTVPPAVQILFKNRASECDKIGDYFQINEPLTPLGSRCTFWCRKPGDWFGKPVQRFFVCAEVPYGHLAGQPSTTRVWKRIL